MAESESSDRDYSTRPRDKAELMDRIQREWSALERAFGRLSKEQLNAPGEGGWSIKDHLAHLAAWERWMRLYHLQNLPPHEVMQIDEETFEQLDEDDLNDVLYQRNRERPAAEVIADLRRSHAQVLDDLAQLSYDDLMKQRYADDPQERPVMDWVIGNTYEHYREHRATIEGLIE